MADTTKARCAIPWTIITEHPAGREAVKRFVSAQVQSGIGGKPAEDQSQINAAKDLIVKEIDLVPEEFNAVSVRADGRMVNGESVVNITVKGAKVLE